MEWLRYAYIYEVKRLFKKSFALVRLSYQDSCNMRVLWFALQANIWISTRNSQTQQTEKVTRFGNRLETDVAFLAETGTWSDCRLVFSAGGFGATESVLELSCHKSILAARSGFFRRLLEKKLGENFQASITRSNHTTIIWPTILTRNMPSKILFLSSFI